MKILFALLLLVALAVPAQAEYSEKCVNKWNDTIHNYAVGCQFSDDGWSATCVIANKEGSSGICLTQSQSYRLDARIEGIHLGGVNVYPDGTDTYFCVYHPIGSNCPLQ